MSYSEDLKAFAASHKYEDVMVDGAKFHYVLNGRKDSQTLVMLNGGMNTLEMWMNYVDAFSEDYQVLLFDYPQELRTNQELVTGMHAFFRKIGVKKPIFVGASDGGMVAQIYIQKYPGEAGGMVLVSTGGMDAETLKTLKKKYFNQINLFLLIFLPPGAARARLCIRFWKSLTWKKILRSDRSILMSTQNW